MTPGRLKVIHIGKRYMKSCVPGFNDDMYRAILKKLGGVDSAKDLDTAGFEAVMEYFASWGFRSDWTKRTFGYRPGMASPGQVQLIRDLWLEFSGSDDEPALNKWLDRHFHVSALRFVTPDAAQKAITGLRRMVARKTGPATGDNGTPSPAA
jgi:hypothetical protein